MDLSKLSNEELQQIASESEPAAQTSSEAMPDLSQFSDDDLAQIAGTGLETGSLREADEAVIQAGGLDTPEGRQKVEEDSHFLAGARPLLDYAIPGGGQAGRDAEAQLIQQEYAARKQPISLAEAQAMSDQRQARRESTYPMTSLISKGIGLGVAGGMVNPGVNMVRSAAGKYIAPELAEIGAMGGLGAVENYMANRSNPDQDVAEDLLNGFMATGGLTALLHTPSMTRKSLSNVNDVFVNHERAKVSRDIKVLDKQADLQTRQAGVTAEKHAMSDKALKTAENDLEALKIARADADTFIQQNPTVAMELNQLPETIKGTFDTSLNNVAGVRNQRLQALNTQRVELDAPYEDLMTSLEKFKPATDEAIKAKREALQAAKNFESSITVEDIPLADPILGKSGQTKRKRSASVVEADAAKQQLQNMIYEREFYKNAPKEVRDAITKFEYSVRKRINDMDPTGELGAANNAYHGLKVAQRDMDDHVNQALFARKAGGKEDVWNVEGILGTSFDLLETPSALTQKGSKVKTAFDDQILNVPVLRDEVQALKKNLRVQIDDVTNRYGRYQEAQKLSKNFTKDARRLEDAIERSKLQSKDNQIQADAQEGARNSLREQKASLAKKDRDLTALDALESIPGLGTLFKKLVKRPARLAETVGRRKARSLGRGIPEPVSIGTRAVTRGASFQTPELTFDVEQALDEE